MTIKRIHKVAVSILMDDLVDQIPLKADGKKSTSAILTKIFC